MILVVLISHLVVLMHLVLQIHLLVDLHLVVVLQDLVVINHLVELLNVLHVLLNVLLHHDVVLVHPKIDVLLRQPHVVVMLISLNLKKVAHHNPLTLVSKIVHNMINALKTTNLRFVHMNNFYRIVHLVVVKQNQVVAAVNKKRVHVHVKKVLKIRKKVVLNAVQECVHRKMINLVGVKRVNV